MQVKETVEFLQKRGIIKPQIGVILGTGLGSGFVNHIRDTDVIPYSIIPNFPDATVEFHKGNLIYGTIGEKSVLVMQGRFHYYEGYSLQQITLPVRVMKQLGIQQLLLSNAAGNLNKNWRKGDLMLLDDHINLQPENPLRGKNDNASGPRFPDMSRPYSAKMNDELLSISEELNIALHRGVYACVSGPNLETRAEYRYLQRIGADAVGMSTIPEVIVANHIGLPCCAISVLTDDCDPDNLKPVDIAEIVETAVKSESKLTELFIRLIRNL